MYTNQGVLWDGFVGLGLEDPSPGSNFVTPFRVLAIWKGSRKPRFWGLTITMLINTSVLHGMILQVGVGLQNPWSFHTISRPERSLAPISSWKGKDFVFLPWCFRGRIVELQGCSEFGWVWQEKARLICSGVFLLLFYVTLKGWELPETDCSIVWGFHDWRLCRLNKKVLTNLRAPASVDHLKSFGNQ